MSVEFKLLRGTLDGKVKEVVGNAILTLGESKKFEIIHIEGQILEYMKSAKEDRL